MYVRNPKLIRPKAWEEKPHSTRNFEVSTKPKLAPTLAAVMCVALMTTSVEARPGQGHEHDFNDSHTRGTPCQEFHTTHPQLDDTETWVVTETFVADASFYGNGFHNRNPMASGLKLHECDATVVAYNSLPLGTVLRATYPATERTLYLVVQDRGGERVSTRPDLARGAFELLGGVEEQGILQRVIYEVLEPAE